MITFKKCSSVLGRALSPCSRQARLVLLLLSLLPVSALSQPAAAVPPVPVRGEIIMLTADLVVVKSTEGTSILIPVGKDTKIDSLLKAGDWVEVAVSPDNQASSVKKMASDPPPR